MAVDDSGMNRDGDPAINLKYLWAYAIVLCGSSAFFLDVDTRVMHLPHPYFGIQIRRGISYPTAPEHMPDVLAQLDFVGGSKEFVANQVALDRRPLRPIASVQPATMSCVASTNRYHFCRPHGRFLCLNTGMMLFNARNQTLSMLSEMLHLLTRYWKSWWEQTMFNFMVASKLRAGTIQFDYLEPRLFNYHHAVPHEHLVVAHGSLEELERTEEW